MRYVDALALGKLQKGLTGQGFNSLAVEL